MKKITITLWLFLIMFSSEGQSDSIQNKNSLQIQKTTDPNEIVIKYEQFLREETKLHREYTQEYYSLILKLLAGIGVVVGGILTWLNWKSKESIKKQVNDQFKETVQDILDEKLKQIDTLIKNGKEKSSKQFEEINKLILELSVKSEKIKTRVNIGSDENDQPDISKLKGKRILWVDDYPVNNEYPIKILSQAGVDFDVALNTEKGLEFLSKTKYDLVISDMGRGNDRTAGLDLIKKMKERNIDTPIIICASSAALRAYGDEALKLGAVFTTNSTTGALNSIQQIFYSK